MIEPPFDAREAWLRDAAQAPAQWRTVSLVAAIRAALQELDPGGPRMALLRDCLEELTARGVEADSLLRYGLTGELIAPISFLQLAGPVLEDRERRSIEEGLRHRGADPDAWNAVLGSLPAGSANMLEVVHALTPLLMWAMSAPLSAILKLEAPELDELRKAMSESPPDPFLLEQYRWLVDRFSITHLADWQDGSLHNEYKYAEGVIAPPCPAELMNDRVVPADDLNAEIAKRTVHPRKSLDPYGGALARQMERQAKVLLGNGHRSEAAALFEFVLSQQPEDSVALNNLGFCLLPDKPGEAIEYLRRARSLGYVPLMINLYNEVLATALAGRYRQALDLAEEHWAAVASGGIVSGVLWRLNATGSLELCDVSDVRGALLDLCTTTAEEVGAPVRDRWLQRAAG